MNRYLDVGLGIGGAHSLALIPRVALLGLLGFWEVPAHILYCDQWSGEVAIVTDAIEPCLFGGKPCVRMEVSDCMRQARYLVNVFDSLP